MYIWSQPNKYGRPSPYRSAAPPRSPGPPPDEPLPQPPPLVYDDSGTSVIQPCWAMDVVRYSTLLGAFTLSSTELKLLKPVPREEADEPQETDRRVTRTSSLIMAGQRIDFGFCTGQRVLRHQGLPMYALANASEEELYRNISAGGAKVMAPFALRRIRIRFLWPLPEGSEAPHVIYDEWVRVEADYTRVQIAMEVAKVFNNFVELHRTSLSQCRNYAWRLRPDAFYRVWLVGLERVENNVFVAEIKYVKEYPNE